MAKNGKRLTSDISFANTDKNLTGQSKQDQNWSFSFLYFKQRELFGVDGCEAKWFVGLIDRLQDMSGKTLEFFGNQTEKQKYRYHSIDWSSKNVPLKRKDFNWVPQKYLDHEDEYPFMQFEISKANGRVVGFFNENSTVFFILLLDPKHNLQPSKNFDYKVTLSSPLKSQYDELLSDLDSLKVRVINCKKEPEETACALAKEVVNLVKKQNLMYLTLDDDFCDIYQEHKNEIKELVEKFLLEKI